MKYRSVRTEVDGYKFASKREATRYQELKLLQRSGEITGLELQPKFPLLVNHIKICTYIADFKYQLKETRTLFHTVVEDVKGIQTPVYRIKKKLFEVLYAPLTITEV